MIKKRNLRVDMCEGPILKNLVIYVIPLIISGLLQLTYNAIDIIVVGRFDGALALSAVGSTGTLVNTVINAFIGLSVGTLVITSRYYGAKNPDGLHEIIHTSILVAIIFGLIISAISLVAIRPILELMNTPLEVLDGATIYATIFLLATPFNLIYNFGSSILRAIGDTKRPLIFLSISGFINVVLNLLFVAVFKMGVTGVALSTAIAQAISAYLVIHSLMLQEGFLKLELKKLTLYKTQLIQIFKIGLPAAIQSSFFSLCNLIVQSSINLFGTFAIAGNATSANLEAFIYTNSNCVQQSAVAFTSQNLGAKKYKRARKVLPIALFLSCATVFSMAFVMYIFRYQLIGLYTTELEVISYAESRFVFIGGTLFISGMLEVTVGHLRGLGYSTPPMLISLLCICAFRFFWIFVVFPNYQTLFVLFLSYPISWTISLTMMLTLNFIIKRKIPKTDEI